MANVLSCPRHSQMRPAIGAMAGYNVVNVIVAFVKRRYNRIWPVTYLQAVSRQSAPSGAIVIRPQIRIQASVMV